MASKRCTQCGVEKPLDEFYIRSGYGDKRHSWCKVCHAKLAKARKRLAYYGLSQEEFDTLTERQCGCCAICGRPFTQSLRCVVDHDHVTGAVRGLLCDKCNLGIGHFNEKASTLIAAAQYLNAHSVD